ncbi:hypothetical protein SEUCBS139899_003831 [Sporothrix eucalyptigena]|uniref:Uncharacterized protein n=1 Tax=Sporothrix eucalyptigena TaxID=1812306 RepID=A0ABP0BE59_9PEZI
MSYPKLVPAFTARVPIDPPAAVGSSKGGLNHVPILAGGSFVSEPGYPIQVDAEFVHGADYIRPDVDGARLRLNVNAILKQKGSADAFFNYSYTGIIEINSEIGKVLTGAPDAATTSQGNAFTHVSFETGNAGLKELENRLYVSAGRFIVEKGSPVIVEYKISEVTV